MSSPVPKWGRIEFGFISAFEYPNPLQDVELRVTFRSPSGRLHKIDGFWDGGITWRARFSPDEVGRWTFSTLCSDTENMGLHHQSGSFICSPSLGNNRFAQHGPVRVAANGHYLAHADGTPFLWVADTAWNGPLRSTTEEWEHYLNERVRQRFTAVQWVTTQWVAAPDGDLMGEPAYFGCERITINPAFFQRLDAKIDAINQVGLLAVPVLLWTAGWSSPEVNLINPGYALPVEQAVRLARYMVARWGAHHVAWILNGDGDYRGDLAGRWKKIGRAVFGEGPHAPVTLHPQGLQWYLDEFQHESWLDMIGYQSGHYGDEISLIWSVEGPPATEWTRQPPRPFINLEPPYENCVAFNSRERLNGLYVRRALYWSMLVSPTAGVTYGGHGVWGWDNGGEPPVNHPTTGVPLPWWEALHMPVAEQVAHLVDLFTSIAWWQLRPAQELLVVQPGNKGKGSHIVASRSESGDLAVVYAPDTPRVELDLDSLCSCLSAIWFNPRNGQRIPARVVRSHDRWLFDTPGIGDWLLLLQPTNLLPVRPNLR